MNSRILFISNRNIITTCGELRLIKNRAETFYSVYGIPTDFIALANSKRINAKQKETIKAGGNLVVIRQDANNLGSVFAARNRIKKEIENRINTTQYSAVICSGSGMPLYAKHIKKINSKIKVFADVHGASEDIIELVKDGPIKRKMFNRAIYILDKHGLKSSSEYVDGYFVVTEALKGYVKQNFKPKVDAKFYIAPCATVNVDDDYFANYEEYRKVYRAKYNLKETTKVFIYSGGVSSWQCIEETISLYKRIKKEITDSKLLVFSHNRDDIMRIAGNDPDIIIDSYRPDELTKALCAGDLAFMLRTDCVTNNVAFPNKFLEYVQSKMRIITTPYVYEIARQVKHYNIGFLYEFKNDREVVEYIKDSSINDDTTVKSILLENGFTNRLKPFVDDFKDAII